jgi:hypothetical protein
MDYFARIGLVLRDLTENSTLNGDKKAEALRLAAELEAASDDLVTIINDRVRATTEAQDGRIVVIEESRAKIEAVVFSTSNAASLGLEVPAPTDEEKARLKDLFNGADPRLFDHDGDGEPGGSEPAADTEDPDQMTVAQATEWLDAHEIDHKGVTLRDDLRQLVREAQVVPDEAGPDTASGT